MYDSSPAFKVSHMHSNRGKSVDIASTTLIFNTKNWGALKERLTVTQVQNEEDRHSYDTDAYTEQRENAQKSISGNFCKENLH